MRDVVMLITKHQANMNDVRERTEIKRKPEAFVDYNNGKSFIEESDQLSSYSTSVRRRIKCYKKVAVELLSGTSIVNFHYLFNKKIYVRLSFQLLAYL